MSGFIALHREALDHHLFRGDSARLGAWFWLIGKACWKPTTHEARGRTITVERGQLCAGREYLAKEWGWSPSAVERFLSRLEAEQMIERDAGQAKTVITICNYDKYQDLNAEPDRNRTETGQKSGHVSGHNLGGASYGKCAEKTGANEQPGHMSGHTQKSHLNANRTTKEQETNNQENLTVLISPLTPQTDFPPDAAQPAEPSRPAAKRKPPAKPPCPCPVDVDPQIWGDFLAMRSRMRAPVSETVVAGFRREADRVGWTLEQAISESVLRGWRGFKADWVKNDDRRNAHQPGPPRPARNEGDGFTRALDRLDSGLGAGGDGFFDRPARAAYR